MKKAIVGIVLVILAAASCRQPRYRFAEMSKWRLSRDGIQRPLEGRPKAVTETAYLAADSDRKEEGMVVKSVFSADGYLIVQAIYRGKMPESRTETQYDANGIETRVMTVEPGDSSVREVTRVLADGRLKTNYLTQPVHSAITSFLDGDRELLVQSYEDTLANSKPVSTSHLNFDGLRFVRISAVGPTDSLDMRFYYSRWDTPDSIRTASSDTGFAGGEAWEYLHYNEHGDPVRQIHVKGRETEFVENCAYRYDARGNWIWRSLTNTRPTAAGDSVIDAARITERVIKY